MNDPVLKTSGYHILEWEHQIFLKYKFYSKKSVLREKPNTFFENFTGKNKHQKWRKIE